jgi:CubicO group peptidase (beta-lactamase class C family)
MTDIGGTCDDRFSALRQAFAAGLDGPSELGASVAVTVDGELVVDMWGGWADADRTRPWERDTIVNVWSTTKTMLTLAALLLVDRGELDVYAPVAKYWPEFAANGKDGIEVRHLMAHTSGVSGWAQPVAVEDLYDWPKSTAMLAAQPPWWEPGTASGYHALNQGHLVGEVVRRITGKLPGDFIRDELTEPLGADFHVGLDLADFDRVSDVIPPPPLPIDIRELDPDSLPVKTLAGPFVHARVANTAAWRTAQIPAASGHGNARSVARIQSVVACGGTLDGRRYLSPDTIELIFDQQSDGVDLVLGEHLRFGIGYGLTPTPTLPHLPDRKICFWGGYGGSSVIADLDNRAVFSYTMNKMAPGLLGSEHGMRYAAAFFAALES